MSARPDQIRFCGRCHAAPALPGRRRCHACRDDSARRLAASGARYKADRNARARLYALPKPVAAMLTICPTCHGSGAVPRNPERKDF